MEAIFGSLNLRAPRVTARCEQDLRYDSRGSSKPLAVQPVRCLVVHVVRQASCKLFLPDPLAYRHLTQRAVEVGVATEGCEMMRCGEAQLS